MLIAGGRNGSTTLSSAELYDPATNSWSPVRAMSSGRFAHAALLLPFGYVLVTGGNNGTTPCAPRRCNYNTAELYNPATASWSATASMAVARGTHTSTLLTSGRVLVVGGEDGSHPLATSELYVP
ncbi:Kelch repeat-containing protein [Cystobacter fuscus]|uniref:Kelch repeat-containing protein n=1 Tax=Cystobacter fuscus TaxID=43 RepID=UPI0037C00692